MSRARGGPAALGLTLGLTLWGCAAVPLGSMDFFGREEPRRHTVFRINWRALIAPAVEAVPPFGLEQSRWAPLETSRPTVVELNPNKLEGPHAFVVAAGSTGHVRAFTLRGQLAWEFAAEGPMGSPSAFGGRVYIGSGNGRLYALDGATGKVLWTYDCSEELGPAPVVKDGLVFVASHGDTLFAIDAETGQWRWHYRRDPLSREFTVRGVGVPLVLNDLVVQGFSDGSVIALRRTDGGVVWQHVIPRIEELEDSDGSPQTDGQRVFIANYKEGLVALGATDGHFLWRHPLPTATHLRVDRGALFATAVGRVLSVSPYDGTTLWERGTGKASPTGLVVTSGLVMVPTDGELFFLNARNGRALGSPYNPGDGVAATPGVFGRDVYVLSNNGWLYAMQLL